METTEDAIIKQRLKNINDNIYKCIVNEFENNRDLFIDKYIASEIIESSAKYAMNYISLRISLDKINKKRSKSL